MEEYRSTQIQENIIPRLRMFEPQIFKKFKKLSAWDLKFWNLGVSYKTYIRRDIGKSRKHRSKS